MCNYIWQKEKGCYNALIFNMNIKNMNNQSSDVKSKTSTEEVNNFKKELFLYLKEGWWYKEEIMKFITDKISNYKFFCINEWEVAFFNKKDEAKNWQDEKNEKLYYFNTDWNNWEILEINSKEKELYCTIQCNLNEILEFFNYEKFNQ